MERYAERLAMFGMGVATVLVVQYATPRLRNMHVNRRTHKSGLSIRHLNASDSDVENEKRFILEGYIGVKRAEGDTAVTESKLSRVRAGLETIVNTGQGKEGPCHILLCRDETGDMCGYLWYGEYDFNSVGPCCYPRPADPYLWVHLVYTTPAARRGGVAAALYEELDRIAASTKIKVIKLDVFTVNEGSIRFHDRLGFRRVAGFYEKDVVVR